MQNPLTPLNWPNLSLACLEKAREMIFWVRHDGSFAYINPAVALVLGYDRQELYSIGAKGILAEITEPQRLALRKRLRKEGSIKVKTTLICKDGSEIPVAATMNHVLVNGEEFDCAFCRDITNELHYEQLLIDEKDRLAYENDRLNRLEGQASGRQIVYKSKVTKKLLQKATKVAEFNMPVLITGETGVGKEVLARYIHEKSSRSEKPFMTVNCANMQASRILSDLFGHVKGAYTGADKDRRGAFELAEGGILFLDEIGEMPIDVQPILLRVLQEKEFTVMGAEQSKKSNIRLVAATNRDLKQRVKKGLFREDLLHRISVLELEISPLRERPDDIPALVNHFLNYLNVQYGTSCLPPRRDMIDQLKRLPLTGNVRELDNLVKKAFVNSSSGRLEFSARSLAIAHEDANGTGFLTLETLQRIHIIKALHKCEGKVSGRGGAAKLLGIERTTLYSRMKKLDIDSDSWRALG